MVIYCVTKLASLLPHVPDTFTQASAKPFCHSCYCLTGSWYAWLFS